MAAVLWGVTPCILVADYELMYVFSTSKFKIEETESSRFF